MAALAAAAASATRDSLRSKDAPTRVLDDATRNRRRRKALEALEKDNFHDDPHANLVMHKKAPKFDDTRPGETDASSSGAGGGGGSAGAAGPSSSSSSDAKRRGARNARSLEYLKQRYRKNFAALLEDEEAVHRPEPPNYSSARAGPSRYPPRHFCAVCGGFSSYTCVTCGMRYCKLACLEVHKETRCLKFTA